MQKYWDLVLLGLLCVFVLINHTLYIFQTHQFPEMDEQHYMYMATGYYKLLQHPSFDTPVKIIQYLPFRQPGYPFLILPFLLFFGLNNSYHWALWINGLLYIGTIVCIYFLTKEFFSKKTGLLASFLFATYGWTLFYLHFTYSETATTFFIVLSLLFLIKSNNFKNKKFSILFGIFFGYSLLIRWVSMIFVGSPLMYTLYNLFKSKRYNFEVKRNITLVFLFTILISVAPYVINYKTFFGDYVKSQMFGGTVWKMIPQERKHFISVQSFGYYLKIFEQLTFFIFSLFIFGLCTLLVHRKKTTILLLSFIVPYLLFSFGTIIKDDRYIVPIYPLVAIISSATFYYTKNLKLKMLLMCIVILYSVGNFFGAVWGIGPVGIEGLRSILIPMPVGHPRRIHVTPIVWPPTKDVTHAEDIMTFLQTDATKNSIENPQILVLFSYHPVDIGMYSINTYQRVKSLALQNFVGMEIKDPEKTAQNVILEFAAARYILVKTGVIVDNYFPQHNYGLLRTINEIVLDKEHSPLRFYKEVWSTKIPKDGSIVKVYRKVQMMSEGDLLELRERLIGQSRAKRTSHPHSSAKCNDMRFLCFA